MGMESPCQKREIRPLAEADIEAYLDIYLNSYPASFWKHSYVSL